MLALQNEPSDQLLLLALEELSGVARKCQHTDADTFDELYRQASRHQGSVNLASLCLSVLGGQAGDMVSKALAKCKKAKEEPKSAKVPDPSPLTNVYPVMPQPQWQSYGNPSMGYGAPYMMNAGYRSRYNPRGRRAFWRPKGACHFCEGLDHQVKDCQLMKSAKQSK